MELKEKTIGKDIKVCGLKCRTSNKDGQATKDLQVLWNKFFAERVMDSLPERVNDNIISIYTEYEGGYQGMYTAFIGFEMKEEAEIPSNLSCHTIPAGEYRVTDIINPSPEKVVAHWNEIWERDEELARNFNTDFEVYHDNGSGTPICVEIFIS